MELVGLENLPEDAFVLVGNHSQAHGAIVAEERLPFDHYTWCAWQMMDKKEVSRYAYTDFWQDKPKAVRWIFWLASKIIKYPAVYIMTHARTIPVYHDSRCLTTFRRSIENCRTAILWSSSRNAGRNTTTLSISSRIALLTLPRCTISAPGRSSALCPCIWLQN